MVVKPAMAFKHPVLQHGAHAFLHGFGLEHFGGNLVRRQPQQLLDAVVICSCSRMASWPLKPKGLAAASCLVYKEFKV
jgi:hypothetical protein